MASRRKKALIGCGIGCGGLIVLVVAVAVSFAIWVKQPGELLEPAVLVGGDTTGYAEWTLRLEDPGTEGFVGLFIEAIRELPADIEGPLPPFVQDWLANLQARQTEKDIHNMFPLVAAWTLRPGTAATSDLHLVSVSVEKMGNQLVFGDWVLGLVLRRTQPDLVEEHGGERIYRFADDFVLFLRGNDLFFTWDLETARQTVDRLRALGGEAREPTRLEQLFAATTDAGPLRAALSNENGEVYRIWKELSSRAVEDPERWQALGGAHMTGGLQPDGNFAATIELIAPDSAWAGEQAEAMATALEQGLDWIPFQLDVRGSAIDDRIRIEMRAPELIESLKRWIAKEAR